MALSAAEGGTHGGGSLPAAPVNDSKPWVFAGGAFSR